MHVTPRAACLIVIPCLNEAGHIGQLLERLRPTAERIDGLIVVADGGSSDDTRGIVEAVGRIDPRVVLIHNPKRLQGAAVNLAVREFAGGAEYFIRMDAHGNYPGDFCDKLLADAEATGADAVVVSMRTVGEGAVQRANAVAQNSRLGTGGSKHRHAAKGEWVDHGHHALMRVAAFLAVGGYDETFSHNEDAELDHRLRRAGYRIWLSGTTHMVYFPRTSLAALYRQYLGYGRGRASNILKHRVVPKVRQILPLLVLPAVLLAACGGVTWIAAVPLAAWLAVCVGYGVFTAMAERSPSLLLVAVSTMIMHFAWSVGFWSQLFTVSMRRTAS